MLLIGLSGKVLQNQVTSRYKGDGHALLQEWFDYFTNFANRAIDGESNYPLRSGVGNEEHKGRTDDDL